MVAELADISTATVDGKSSYVGGTSKYRKRPKWIQTATREPIYSILDSNESVATRNLSPGAKIVVISAVKNEPSRKSKLENEQRESSYIWLSSQNKTSPTPEVKEEDTLYSVVRKPKKVRLPETPSETSEEAIRSVDKIWDINPNEKLKQQLDPEDVFKGVEVRKWLCDTPRRSLPDLPKMYFDHSEYENPWSDQENSVALPRGVVGLVGPYRVYRNPNERREYMLREEELVEEVVDSANEEIQEEEGKSEHRSRAKWKIKEDDEETLVPDIRNLPDFMETRTDINKKENNDWKDECESMTKGDKLDCIEGILPGKEERAVDVPDTISAISMTSIKEKRASNEQHDKDSLNETGSTTGGTVEGAPGGGPSRGDRTKDKEDQASAQASTSAPPARSLVSRILARTRSPEDLLDHSEP
ncbi:hypothetical protein P5V15_010339 [Pogonomyrmex californicus]